MYCLNHQGVVGAVDKLYSALCLLLGSHNGNFLAGRMESNAYTILLIDVGLAKKRVGRVSGQLDSYGEDNVLFYVWRLNYGTLHFVFVLLLNGLDLLVDWCCFLISYEADKMDYLR